MRHELPERVGQQFSIAARVIMLFDARKLGRTSFTTLASLDAVDAVVTDTIGAGDRARLEERSIDFVVAGVRRTTGRAPLP